MRLTLGQLRQIIRETAREVDGVPWTEDPGHDSSWEELPPHEEYLYPPASPEEQEIIDAFRDLGGDYENPVEIDDLAMRLGMSREELVRPGFLNGTGLLLDRDGLVRET